MCGTGGWCTKETEMERSVILDVGGIGRGV